MEEEIIKKGETRVSRNKRNYAKRTTASTNANEITSTKRTYNRKPKVVDVTEPLKEETVEPTPEIQEKKKKTNIFSRIAKLFSWAIMIVLALVGGFLIAYVAINKISQAKGDTPPLGLYTIISPSMTPKIQVYDVVFVVKTDPEDIEIGDVISYYSTKEVFNGVPITHRVVEKYNTAQGYVFRTQGDANPVADDEFIMEGSVVGKVRGVIPQLGRIQFFLTSKAGWIVAILIPAIGILIYDVLKLFRLIKARNEMLEVRRAINK